MKKTVKITRKDLKTLIRETIYKLSLLNESMEEGGKAGHMSHPFDVDEFTFGDYKQLVQDLFETRIERYSEKLDGMNIYATVSEDGKVRFARSTTHIKSAEGGMDPAGIAERWGSEGKDPSIYASYENAYNLFTDVIKKLPDPVDFFNGDGYRIYVNCEVIDARHPNVIPYVYPRPVISFHGLAAFTNDGTGKEVDLPDEIFDEKMAVLEQLMPSIESQYGQPQITPTVVIEIRENCQDTIDKFISDIDHIEDYAGVNDNATIVDYRATLLPDWMRGHGFEIILNNPFTERFIRRWVYGETKPNITAISKEMERSGMENWQEVYKAARYFEGFKDDGTKKKGPLHAALKEIMRPVENFFYALGNEVISRVKGYANEGHEEKTIQGMVNALENTQKLLKDSNDLELQAEMTYWLQRLSLVDYKYNSMEGVVFNWRGETLKLTGSFAALNRAVNLRIQYYNKQKNQDA